MTIDEISRQPARAMTIAEFDRLVQKDGDTWHLPPGHYALPDMFYIPKGVKTVIGGPTFLSPQKKGRNP